MLKKQTDKNQVSAPDGQRGRCFAPWAKAVENATRLRASLTAFTHFAHVDHRTHYRGRFGHLLQQDQEPSEQLLSQSHLQL